METGILWTLEAVAWGAIVWSDVRYFVIPDMALFVLIVLWIGEGFLALHPMDGGVIFFLCGIFLCLKIGFEKVLNRLALGWGDVKLAGVCGLWLRFSDLPAFLSLTGLIGCGLGGLLLIMKHQRYFPLAPAMALAFGVVRMYRGVLS